MDFGKDVLILAMTASSPGIAGSPAPDTAIPHVSSQRRGRRIRFMKYDMRNFLEQCVERYIELGGNRIKDKLKVVETPFLDESKPEFDENPVKENDEIIETLPGVLGDIASAVLMKILYAARMGRFDLIRPVSALASRITKWTHLCDKRPHRLICYIHS